MPCAAHTLDAVVVLSCHSNKHGEALLKKLFEASASIALANFSPENLSQLYLTQLAMDVERPELKLKLPPPLLHRATEFHKKEMMSTTSSKFHLDVSATLTQMSVQNKNEEGIIERAVGRYLALSCGQRRVYRPSDGIGLMTLSTT